MFRNVWLAICLALLSAICAGPAAAKDFVNFGDRLCTLSDQGHVSPQAIIKQRANFDCSDGKLSKKTDHIWLLADVTDLRAGISEPVLRFRGARHGPITLTAVYSANDIKTTHYSLAQMRERWRSPYAVSLDLLDDKGQYPQTILIGVEDPWDPSNWQDIEIGAAEADIKSHQNGELIGALVAGLLFAPLLLDLVFFIALRQRFVIFHSLMVTSILVNHICWSGQIFDLFPQATMVDRSWVAFLALGVLAFSACMLIRNLCDDQKLGRLFKFALPFMGTACFATTAVVVLFAEQLSYTGSQIFHIVYGLCFLTAAFALLRCAIRGDRMAMLQLAGVGGGLIIAFSRILRALGFVEELPIFDYGFYFIVLVEVVATSTAVGYRAIEVRRQRDAAIETQEGLSAIAYADELTGLPNRRSFIRDFALLTGQDEQPDQSRALMIIDIDHFKQINDRFGHVCGDQVLKQLGNLLRANCREHDRLARFGGEEFVVLATGRTEQDLQKFGQRLVKTVSQTRFGSDDLSLEKITISLGMHLLPAGKSPALEDHFRIADKALYEAKKNGRNRMCQSTNTEWVGIAA